MCRLSESELKILQDILIKDGWVLDFNNAEFRQFVFRVTGIDVHESEYSNKVNETMGSSSKGKTLTYFCYNESETDVLKLLTALIERADVLDHEEYEIDSEKLEKAKNILNKHNNENNLELPKLKSDDLKVFISYSSIDEIYANNVHKMLTEADIECFLASDNIKGGEDWEPQIFKRLLNSNFFILMLSENFLKSIWCNQEAGIAFLQYKHNDVPLIPIKIDDTEPYGIFRGVQRVKYDDFNSLEEFVNEINIKSISFEKAFEKVKINRIKEINKLIENLRYSKGYGESNNIFDKLKSFNLSLKQAKEVIEIAATNDQVALCDEAPIFVSKYIHIFGKELESKNLKTFKSYWTSFDFGN